MEPCPAQLVTDFLNQYRAGVYLRDSIARLAELALAEDSFIAESATRAIFTAMVEPLADSFEPDDASLYNRAFAQIIQACRRNPRASEIHSHLEQYGLVTEGDLIARADRVRQPILPGLPADSGQVRRIIVLSRVTLGADVAITSVIIERLKHRFPAAEIVLLGGSKTSELFGADPRLRFKEIVYRRAGTTVERLLAWIDLVRCLQELIAGLKLGEYLVVDPDSRLTQLGLLPVSRPGEPAVEYLETGYLFFPSREYGSGTSRSLSELTAMWLDDLLLESLPSYPRVALRTYDTGTAGELVRRISRGSRPVVSINFGVGGNPLKRVGGDFEAMLVAGMLQQGAVIVLDKGAGDDEIERADAVIREATRIERDGRPVRAVEVVEQSLTAELASEKLDAEILVWNGRIGMLGALIGESDLYIGYDSAGQHIAAALGVSCIDVFAGFSSRRMLDRWRPSGPADTRIVAVESQSDPNQIVGTVLDHARDSLRLGRRKRE